MDAKERYFWDLTGYLVIRNVLTPDELRKANAAIDYYSAKVINGDGNSPQQPGRPRVHDNVVVRTSNQHPYFLEMERPYCEPFRNMLVHPQIVSRLNVMCGKGFRLDHGPELIGHIKGVAGGQLHGSGEVSSCTRGMPS